MGDTKPTSRYFSNLGGVNLKSSEYTTQVTQWLDLRNVDFDVPNALQKRPGFTQSVGQATSGPVIGLFEFKRLDGASWVIAGTDTALFFLAANNFSLLDPGWTNGQPQDFLTFLNKLWVTNGQKMRSWDGGASYGLLRYGLPEAPTVLNTPITANWNGASFWFVSGATGLAPSGSSGRVTPAIFVAYSYVRSDGYYGPLNVLRSARNVVQWTPATSGTELFSTSDFSNATKIHGFTVPPNNDIAQIALWVGGDIMNQGTSTTGLAQKTSGSSAQTADYTLAPGANSNQFRFFTLIPAANLFTMSIGATSVWAATFIPQTTLVYSAGGGPGSSIMVNNFFESFTPKYIDINQNVMFLSGFSSAPSDVWFSEIAQPETIPADYQFEVRTNDGDRIMGHKTYNNMVVVFKEDSFHKILGSSPEDFQLVELSTEFGLLSNNAVVEYNEKLLFLDKKGIIRFDGSGWQCISDGIDEVFRRMNLDAAKEKAVGIHLNYRNQVWFGIPVDGSTQNNLTIVYDYLVNAWTFFDGFNPSSFANIKGALSKPTGWRGSYSGMIYYMGESFYGDNGMGISCSGFSRYEQFEGENSTNVWRRLFLDVATAPGGLTGTINGEVFTDYNSSSVKATFVMPQNVFQSKAEMGVVGKAVAMKFNHYSASLPLLINGFSWSRRNLRNV